MFSIRMKYFLYLLLLIFSKTVNLQDDTKILLAKPEVGNLLDTLQKQQQQFLGLPEQIGMEPTIPITFTKVSHS